MFSHEISGIMESCHYNIDSKTYINILLSSPQLDGVKFDPYNHSYEMWDEENNYWKFTVYRKDD